MNYRSRDKRVKRFFKRILGFFTRTRKRKIVFGSLLVIVIAGLIYFASFDKDILEESTYSTTFYDRRDKPLRTFLSSDETYARRCRLSEVSPHFLRAIVLIEDKSFYSHKGVVPSSLFRALWQNIKGQRIVSGGSTITMQTVKMVYRHKKRTVFNKIAEIFAALKFELHLTKSEILEAYLDRLPFGNMIYGVKEAARFYFGKDPSELSLNQAIYLALIPKSPSRYNPLKHLPALKKRWKTILDIFRNRNHITGDEYQRAAREGISFRMNRHPFLAPHFIERVKETYEGRALPEQVFTTLDYQVQETLQGIVREHLVRLAPYDVGSAAAIVIDNRSHEIVGFLGSPDYFNEAASGHVDLATALRQPGSTLKPFVYGLALESGYTPASIVPDTRFPSKGGFFPKNHDGREHGPLRLRIALACSYNIPAFYMAMKLTPARVIGKLKHAGFTSIKSEPGFYGETIALGSGEVRLLDLVTAYSAFGNKGMVYYPALVKGKPVRRQRVFDEKTAFLIWDILADASARFASFGYHSSMNLPFPAAIKTGTSKGFRDKWAVGVNALYTIGVWIGNPDGKDMKDTTGVGTVSAMLRDIFLALQKDWTLGNINVPDGVIKETVCALSGLRLSRYCPDTVEEYFDETNVPGTPCDWHVLDSERVAVNYPELYRTWALKNNPGNTLTIGTAKQKRISFPQQGDFFYLSDAISKNDQQITFEVMGFEPGEQVEYYLDGKMFRRLAYPDFPVWPLSRGDHTLEIKKEDKIIDKISFIVR
jgi:penicillin-binding protein 1C